jgi:uncharacterized protein YecT (DUF1311 family)
MITCGNVKSSAPSPLSHAGRAIIICVCVIWSNELLAATDADMTKQYLDCMERSGGITADMLECINKETARQDTVLNDKYKRLMSRVSNERQKLLLEAQRAWIKFRDANCSFYAEGGSIAQVAANDCFLQATVDRAKELERLTPDQ